jgi:hypothetical protein
MVANTVRVAGLAPATIAIACLSRAIRLIFLIHIITALSEKEERSKKPENDTPRKTFPTS